MKIDLLRHFHHFSEFNMEHLRLGVFESARLIAGAQPSSIWLLRLLCFSILAFLALISFFISTTQGGVESPGYFLDAGPIWRWSTFWFFLLILPLLFICRGERASD